MAEQHTMMGQASTDVYTADDGAIIISQWNEEYEMAQEIRFDRLFVPTLIAWLQEMVAPKAVG